MHCPNVSARTATPVSTRATSWTPGIARTRRWLRSRRGVPLSVGARQTIVGSAPATWRSVTYCLRPVTASRASIRGRPTPTTRKSAGSLSRTSTGRVVVLAAARASSAYDSDLPFGACTTPPRARRLSTVSPSWIAAASSSAFLAIAAATRIGVYVEIVEFEPPVSWFHTSSGRASASVTRTFSTGSSSSSAISMAVEVVMPWPTSIRGSAKDAVPSWWTLTVIRLAVGVAASVKKSLRS